MKSARNIFVIQMTLLFREKLTQTRNHFHVKIVENIFTILISWLLIEEQIQAKNISNVIIVKKHLLVDLPFPPIKRKHAKFPTIFKLKWFLICVNVNLVRLDFFNVKSGSKH